MRFFTYVARRNDEAADAEKSSKHNPLFIVAPTLRTLGLDFSLQYFNLCDHWPSLSFSIETGSGNEGLGVLFSVAVNLLWWNFGFQIEHSSFSEMYKTFNSDEYIERVASVSANNNGSKLGFYVRKHSCIGPSVCIIDDGPADGKGFDIKSKEIKGSVRQWWHGRWRRLSNEEIVEMYEEYGPDNYCTKVLRSDFCKYLDH